MAALLLASLLPVTFAAAAQATHRTASYADWVRLQLREPADEVVAHALEAATATASRSLEAFLEAFIEAYEARQPERPLAQAFAAAADLSNEALISLLEARYLGFTIEAVLPRVAFTAATGAVKQVLKRGPAPLALVTRHDLLRRTHVVSLQPPSAPAFILPLRTRCAAQPLGP